MNFCYKNIVGLILVGAMLSSSQAGGQTIITASVDFDHRVRAKSDSTQSLFRSPTGAMIRSLIIPGWGQVYNKKYVKAILIFCAESGLLANSIYLNQKYKASKTELEREFYINNRNLSNWWLVGVILFSMADAFVDAHLADFDESPDLSYLKIVPIGNFQYSGVALSIGIRF